MRSLGFFSCCSSGLFWECGTSSRSMVDVAVRSQQAGSRRMVMPRFFGWIGIFILGIGFYSIPKMTGRSAQPAARGWIAWLLWTSGVLLRWASGFYHLYWRMLLPISATLELAAFIIFLFSVRSHRPAGLRKDNEHMPVW